MDTAWFSLAALLVVIVVSCTTRANPGVLAIVLAWPLAALGTTADGKPLGTAALVAGFPTDLFLTLVGVSLLFCAAEANGTLLRVATFAQRLCRGNLGAMAVMFLLLVLALGTIGPGNIAVAGIMAPLAMAAAQRTGIPPLLMALIVGHGAIGSTLSPLTSAGVVADKILAEMNLGGHEWQLYTVNAVTNVSVGLAGFLILGGWRLFGQREASSTSECAHAASLPFSIAHRITLAVIAALVVAVVVMKAHVGLASFAGALVLGVLGMADERETFRRIPWNVILMVSLVSVLASLVDKSGGMRRFAELINQASTDRTVHALLAFVTGVVSIFSSTTGVVLPAFLPMVKDLAAEQPQSNPMSLAYSVLLGGNLVDVSPLSTIGALCVAASSEHTDRRKLFKQLLLWGFAMAVVAAVICGVAF